MPAFDYRWRAPESLVNVEDYRKAARKRLPNMVWHFVDGGADDLVTRDDNRAAFSRWSLRPRVLAGVAEPDLATKVAGVPVTSPILLAPTGFTGLAHWRGDVAAARAAERKGTRYVLSTMSSWSIEEVARETTEDHFFQLYPHGGSATRSLLTRAWDAGVRVLFVTVDVPVIGNREAERRTGMGKPPVLTPRRALDVARHPRWLYELLRHQRISGRNLVTAGGLRGAVETVDLQSRELVRSTLSWDDLRLLRDLWRGRLFVKGILGAADAARAVGAGMDGVVVSNHGGRQLDCAPAAVDALPAVVAEVGDRAEVLIDGGIRRGSDVVKALALGARAVLVGRPYVYGLAVGGEAGVARVLDILTGELQRTMTLMGVPSLADLDGTLLARRG